MQKPLMSRSIAIWLVHHTALTFAQIAHYCRLHVLEVQAIADGELGGRSLGLDPVIAGDLSLEEITLCEQDPERALHGLHHPAFEAVQRKKKSSYTPASLKPYRLGSILWLLKMHPALSDGQIASLMGSTTKTVHSLRDRTHSSYNTITIHNPMDADLIDRSKLEAMLQRLSRKQASLEKV